jgi:cell division inhibitor SulA/protein ImuA
MNLESLLQRADIWRGGTAPPAQALPCGFAELDRLLPGGGLPRGALTEILIDREGIGELSLLLPALARATEDERWLVFVAPPYIPYAPALARAGVNLARVLVVHPHVAQDSLWAIEQALRAGTASVVLAWLAHAEPKALRRLQLAAEAGGSLGILFRQARRAEESSPAALCLKLEPASLERARVAVHILKRRGGWPIGPVLVEVDHAVARPLSPKSSTRGLRARLPRA